ncbi:hypothetical protein BDD12DRAFT_881036 [Trichophaea hybrida]|nr:hypothetical protein BDD12DRAFT_881036 [Trichophaea hybrida]
MSQKNRSKNGKETQESSSSALSIEKAETKTLAKDSHPAPVPSKIKEFQQQNDKAMATLLAKVASLERPRDVQTADAKDL